MISTVCPDCKSELSPGARRCECGWQKTPPSTNGNARDPDWWRCADELLGQRCGKAGSMSHGTHGGGPFYCAAHFHRQDPNEEQRAVAPGYIQSIREVLRPIARDPEADAERRAIQGEP